MFVSLPKRIARSFGVELKRYSRFRRAIDLLAAAGEKPYFVQIGANNGIDFDDLYWSVVEHDLPGIAVEPVPDYSASLEHAYSRQPEVVPIRAAIHPTAEQMTIYRVKPERVTVKWQHGLASFDRDHLVVRHHIAADAILEEGVSCLSFSALLTQIPEGRTIDILAIDTEGFDAEILKMIDFDALRPKIIRFEAHHMTADQLQHWTSRLRALGYNVRMDGLDCLALSESLELKPWNIWRRQTPAVSEK